MLYEVITATGAPILQKNFSGQKKRFTRDGQVNEAAIGYDLIQFLNPLKSDGDFGIDLIVDKQRVITSYSIHYTKLYEPKVG